ncbi:putative pectinacetylesterase/NOTUM [Helianthus annuus]|nr:putative pectinacetylesterase/NOTUM [Helianthus annuus]
MPELNFTGLMSNQQDQNPNLYNWNRVYMRYCDGASFTGDVEEVDHDNNLYFRGARVFDAIVEELMSIGMKDAQNVLLSGCSAGGLASIVNCDKFRGFFPQNTRVNVFLMPVIFLMCKFNDFSLAQAHAHIFCFTMPC